ncbi:hypothetical protein JCM39194_23280 [Desulfotomaculum varum]
MKSIRWQITVFVLLLTLLPLAVSGLLAYNASNQMAQQAAEERMAEASNVSRRALNRSQNEIAMLAELLSENQLLAQALQKGDRAALQQLLQPAYQMAQKSFPINTLEVTDAQGIVLMRGHNPDKFGDNKKDHEQVSKALNGQFVRGLTISHSTGEAALDAMAPVRLDNQLVGTVKAGLYINNQLAEFLGQTTGSDVLFFYNIDGRYLLKGHTAVPEGSIFKQQGDRIELIDSQLISQLVENKNNANRIIHKRLKVHGLDHFVAFAPLSDLDGKIRGIVAVAVDADTLQQASVKMHRGLLLNTVLAGLVAALLALWYAGRLTRPIIQVADAHRQLVAGNLDVYLDVKRQDEIGLTAQSLNDLAAGFRQVLGELGAAAEKVANVAEDLSNNSQQTTAAATATATNMSQVADNAEQVAENTRAVAADAAGAAAAAEQGRQQLLKVEGQMDQISRAADSAAVALRQLNGVTQTIGEMVNMITGIAEQTNLLALNAAIEAARAGEHGRGFAVVADEVRVLAERSAQAAQQIMEHTKSINQSVELALYSMEENVNKISDGAQQVTDSGKVFAGIIEIVDKLHSRVKEVARAADEISAAVQNAAAATQQQTAAMEEVTSTTHELHSLSNSLKNLATRWQKKQ